MSTQPLESRMSFRHHLPVFVAQLVLTAAAVLISRTAGRGLAGTAAVMVVAAANAAVVAFALMGVRRSGRWIVLLLLATIVFVAGLLVWPAWDVYERTGAY